MKKMKTKMKAFALTILVTLNLGALLIVQGTEDIGSNIDNWETIWSLLTFVAVLGLAIYWLNICFENNK